MTDIANMENSLSFFINIVVGLLRVNPFSPFVFWPHHVACGFGLELGAYIEYPLISHRVKEFNQELYICA